MLACSPERRWRAAVAVALALVLPGCVTGHLFAAGRRREYAREMDPPIRDGATMVVCYTAEVTDDAGASRGTVVRMVRVDAARGTPSLRELTRIRSEPWVYPLVPLTLAADVVVVPILVLMSPAVLIFGD